MTSCSLINAADPRATLSSRDQRTPSAACLPTAHDLRMIGGGGGGVGGGRTRHTNSMSLHVTTIGTQPHPLTAIVAVADFVQQAAGW